jgi:hypothetical protein
LAPHLVQSNFASAPLNVERDCLLRVRNYQVLKTSIYVYGHLRLAPFSVAFWQHADLPRSASRK